MHRVIKTYIHCNIVLYYLPPLQSFQKLRYLPKISNRWRATVKLKITKFEKGLPTLLNILLMKYINM